MERAISPAHMDFDTGLRSKIMLHSVQCRLPLTYLHTADMGWNGGGGEFGR
ncbi:MAG TPA: hypothetical protein PKC82_08320 [Chitinophagaceae bacterium]|nr:hypothetical protein [Chitinophagaceae bacterium]HMX77198.1 hypothetical protein [Chitinophagaceae bacterium]HNA92846.1 hypothetical protein [Chitinophagaceae bacterium]HNA96101.1 hypothetical protein [Chitinophagaceae bacterium]HND96450.1 hypothetical protein [Chitinophagaceae bacterium]